MQADVSTFGGDPFGPHCSEERRLVHVRRQSERVKRPRMRGDAIIRIRQSNALDPGKARVQVLGVAFAELDLTREPAELGAEYRPLELCHSQVVGDEFVLIPAAAPNSADIGHRPHEVG